MKIFYKYVTISHNFVITFHDVIILIQSFFNKDKKNYYYNIFLEKASYELPKSADYRCIITEISNCTAMNLMQDINLSITKNKLLSCIKMSKEVLTFGDIEIEKKKIYCRKTPIF